MMSLASRYEAGEWTEVWDEIRRLGPVPSMRQADVADVARATMARANAQIRSIVDGLFSLGFEPANSDVPVLIPPPPDVIDRLARMESSLGPLPEALKASMTRIGYVSLLGDCADISLHYHRGPSSRVRGMPPGRNFPDPLCLPDILQFESEWEERRMDSRLASDEPFQFAPDELHKANISGGAHEVRLPDSHADPVLLGVAGRPGISLVEYFRTSVSWGGFPGFAFYSGDLPKSLEGLTARPLF